MAHQLGVTLDTIQNMSSKEYMGWIEYFKQRPFGWREDHRTAILAQTTYQGSKPLKVNQLFPTLQILEDATNHDPNRDKGIAFLKGIAKKNKVDWK